jgi:hypothetical protein
VDEEVVASSGEVKGVSSYPISALSSENSFSEVTSRNRSVEGAAHLAFEDAVLLPVLIALVNSDPMEILQKGDIDLFPWIATMVGS